MSDFYGTASGFKSYWTARGGDALIITTADDEVNIALLIASEWIDAAFRDLFAGIKIGGRDQIRELPRSGMQDIHGYSVASDVVPREGENATYEAAYRQLKTPGIFYRDYTPSKYKNVAVTGAISVQYRYGDAFDFQTQMPGVAAAIAPILKIRGSFSNLSGNSSRV